MGQVELGLVHSLVEFESLKKHVLNPNATHRPGLDMIIGGLELATVALYMRPPLLERGFIAVTLDLVWRQFPYLMVMLPHPIPKHGALLLSTVFGGLPTCHPTLT